MIPAHINHRGTEHVYDMYNNVHLHGNSVEFYPCGVPLFFHKHFLVIFTGYRMAIGQFFFSCKSGRWIKGEIDYEVEVREVVPELSTPILLRSGRREYFLFKGKLYNLRSRLILISQ